MLCPQFVSPMVPSLIKEPFDSPDCIFLAALDSSSKVGKSVSCMRMMLQR